MRMGCSVRKMVELEDQMPRKKKQPEETALVAVPPEREATVLPPENGVVGHFLDNIRNTFKARAMRMNGLLNRIDETGQRMEAILRMAAEKSDAALARLEQDLLKEGLAPEQSDVDEDE